MTTSPTLYRTICIDPPWLERGGGKIKRGADRHYPLLHTADIPGVIKAAPCWLPAPNCHLYLWVTNNHLPDGLWVVAQLGFRYITLLTWAKDRIGLGRYFRGQTEHLIFAVQGAATMPTTKGSTLITAKRRAHSQKPDEAYALMEQSPEPRLDMFARQFRREWDVWGYFDEAEEPSWFSDLDGAPFNEDYLFDLGA